MKKSHVVALLVAVCMLFALSACGTQNNSAPEETGRQTASAYLDQSENAVVEVTVDLSDGWSVEFARGAVYLYDQEIADDLTPVAMLVTLDKEVYDEYIAEAQASESFVQADDGVFYTMGTGEGAFVVAVDDSAYALITTLNADDIEAVAARFSMVMAA